MTDELLSFITSLSPGVSVNKAGDVVNAPWCVSMSVYSQIQSDYQKHLLGPKIDFRKELAFAGIENAGDGCRYEARGSVALVFIEGTLYHKPNLFTKIWGGCTLDATYTNIKRAMADDRVKSIVLVINSPGGSIFGVAELADAVHKFSSKKPIVAHTDQNMLSAANWIGSAANSVYLSGPTVQMGSVGVVMRRTFDPALGIRSMEFFAGRHTKAERGMGVPDQQTKDLMQDRVNYLYDVFVEQVAIHRGVSVAYAHEHMAEGRVFIGSQAIDAGMADGFMTLDELVTDLDSNPGQFAKRRRLPARRAGQAFSRRMPAATTATATPANQACHRVMNSTPAKRYFRSADELKRAALDYAAIHQTTFPEALTALGYAA